MVPVEIFTLSGSRNQVNGADWHHKAVCSTIYTTGQQITSGLRKLHVLPRLVYIVLTYSDILFYTGVETTQQWKQNKYTMKNKKKRKSNQTPNGSL